MGAQYHNGHWYGGGQDIDIQSDPTATSFDPNKVPTGATAESVLNSNLYMLDYANAEDILSSVNTVNNTYTATKSGIIKVLALNNSNGDGYYALRNNSIALTSGYSAFVIYCRDYNLYNGTMQTCIVSKGDTLKVEAISNKTVHSATFIPFKLL